MTKLAKTALRLALAAGFLSAVADRFGLWGAPGAPGVAWGAFKPFLDYTGTLLWYLPAGLVTAAGWAATVLEVVLALGLLSGVGVWAFALASGILLSLFGIAMTTAYGLEAPLSYSVWTAAASAFLLASLDSTSRQNLRRAGAASETNQSPHHGKASQDAEAPRTRN